MLIEFALPTQARVLQLHHDLVSLSCAGTPHISEENKTPSHSFPLRARGRIPMNFKTGALSDNLIPLAKGRAHAATQRRSVYLQLCKLPNAQLSARVDVDNEIMMVQAFPLSRTRSSAAVFPSESLHQHQPSHLVRTCCVFQPTVSTNASFVATLLVLAVFIFFMGLEADV